MDLNLINFEDWPRFSKAFRMAKPERLPQLAPVEAHPGCGRVIVLSGNPDKRSLLENPDIPPFVSEWAVVRHGAPLGLIADVLTWYCGREDSRAKNYANWLSIVMNGEVREVSVRAKSEREVL